MILCKFDGDRCIACGAPKINARQVCGIWRPGVGDMVAAGLDAIGINKARAQAVAQAFGLGDCGCAERQQLLNDLGNAVGIGTPPPEAPPPPAQ